MTQNVEENRAVEKCWHFPEASYIYHLLYRALNLQTLISSIRLRLRAGVALETRFSSSYNEIIIFNSPILSSLKCIDVNKPSFVCFCLFGGFC